MTTKITEIFLPYKVYKVDAFVYRESEHVEDCADKYAAYDRALKEAEQSMDHDRQHLRVYFTPSDVPGVCIASFAVHDNISETPLLFIDVVNGRMDCSCT